MTSNAFVLPTSNAVSTLAPDIHPVRFELIHNALLAITEEMGANLRRIAYSSNITTRGDFSCAFFDRRLRIIAQAFTQPSHLGSLAHIVPPAVAAYGPEHLKPGDDIPINDPFLGGVHLNDFTLRCCERANAWGRRVWSGVEAANGSSRRRRRYGEDLHRARVTGLRGYPGPEHTDRG
jgi:hypothetical protein